MIWSKQILQLYTWESKSQVNQKKEPNRKLINLSPHAFPNLYYLIISCQKAERDFPAVEVHRQSKQLSQVSIELQNL